MKTIKTFVNRKSKFTRVNGSNSGDLIAAASQNGRRLIWDTGSWRVIQEISGTNSSMAWPPNNESLATINNGSLVIWDAYEGAIIKQVPCAFLYNFVDWSKDGSMIAVGGLTQEGVSIYGRNELNLVKYFHTREWLDFQPQEGILNTGGYSGSIKWWDYAYGRLDKKMDGHTSFVSIFLGNTAKNFCLSCAADGKTNFYNIKTGVVTKTLDGHTGKIKTLWSIKEVLGNG